MSISPTLKALSVTAFFSAVGIWGASHADPGFLVPHAIFYVVITINTFYSVRFFSSFTPPHLIQTLVDCALLAAYVALALSIGNAPLFSFFALAIFVVAPMKYAHLLGKTPYDATLRKKILIDLWGNALTAVVFAATAFGYPIEAAWFLATIFFIANIYWLIISPMYRHV